MEALQPATTLNSVEMPGMAGLPEAAKRRLAPLPHIRELDGVRGIAALAVVFHHICFTSIDPQYWGPGVRFLYWISKTGKSGVDLFFVLSAFLITSILLGDRTKPAYYRNFYWKRALRILPLYFICLMFVYLFVPHSGRYVLISAFFLANFGRVFHVDLDGPFWTLAIEEHFYLIWPTIVRRRRVETLASWCVGIIVAVNLLRIVAACFGHHDYVFTFFNCDGLAIGALLACRRDRNNSDPRRTAVPTPWLISAIIAGLALDGIGALQPHNAILSSLCAAALQCAHSFLAGAFIAIVLTHAGAPFLALLRSRLFTFFGLISYAVYMSHLYILQAYDHFRPLPQGNLAAYIIRLAVVLGITILVSVLSRYLIERPSLSLRKYVLKTPRQKQEVVV